MDQQLRFLEAVRERAIVHVGFHKIRTRPHVHVAQRRHLKPGVEFKSIRLPCSIRSVVKKAAYSKLWMERSVSAPSLTSWLGQ
jgi:hypothetical protein